MGLHVVHYAYSSDTVAARGRLRPAHAAFLADLEANGVLVFSGPYVDGAGALFRVRADSTQKCSASFDADPFWRAGLVVGREIRPFVVGFGLPDEVDRVAVPAGPE